MWPRWSTLTAGSLEKRSPSPKPRSSPIESPISSITSGWAAVGWRTAGGQTLVGTVVVGTCWPGWVCGRGAIPFVLALFGGRGTTTGMIGGGGSVALVPGPPRPSAELAALTGPERPIALASAAIGRKTEIDTLR